MLVHQRVIGKHRQDHKGPQQKVTQIKLLHPGEKWKTQILRLADHLDVAWIYCVSMVVVMLGTLFWYQELNDHGLSVYYKLLNVPWLPGRPKPFIFFSEFPLTINKVQYHLPPPWWTPQCFHLGVGGATPLFHQVAPQTCGGTCHFVPGLGNNLGFWEHHFQNGGFPKSWGVGPQSSKSLDHFGKPLVLGYHHFRNPRNANFMVDLCGFTYGFKGFVLKWVGKHNSNNHWIYGEYIGLVNGVELKWTKSNLQTRGLLGSISKFKGYGKGWWLLGYWSSGWRFQPRIVQLPVR